MNDIATDPAITRPAVFSLVIRSKAALYAAWIPLLRGGGIFVPSTREHNLGEEVLILLSLLDDSVKIPIHGHVAWVNCAHAASNRPQGFGVQLPNTETCRELKKRIEGLLAGALQSTRQTHTI
ncbi:MAG TPA: PilZ domain-containing protein [Usitatibacteraceae bacterium]|nr:PilZ domain-containing protein [Usitatibacteraceae bacterium]